MRSDLTACLSDRKAISGESDKPAISMLASSSRDRLQVEVPSTQGLDAIVQFTNTDKLHQKLLYLQCIPAAATSTKYDDNIDVLLPLMEELGHDEDQPEEVKLEIAAQLPALGKLSAELVLHNLVTGHESKQRPSHVQCLHWRSNAGKDLRRR